MALLQPLMLAITTEELIMAAIGLIIVVGSWLSNAYKQRQEADKSRPGASARPGSDTHASAERIPQRPQHAAALQRAQEQAAQRRAQLQELARQRREALRRTEPDNLTMADAQQRAQAQAAYQQRAQQLRQQRPASVQTATIRQTPSGTRLPGEQIEAAQRRMRQQQQRQAQIERQRQLARAQQREQARRLELQRQRQALQQQQAAPARTLSSVAPPAAITTSATAATPLPTDIASLRQAFMMKEILDRPLALRESPDPYDQW